jgi:hypothetical protein
MHPTSPTPSRYVLFSCETGRGRFHYEVSDTTTNKTVFSSKLREEAQQAAARLNAASLDPSVVRT